MSLIPQGDARINKDSLFSGSYQAAYAANSQRFRPNYFKIHRLISGCLFSWRNFLKTSAVSEAGNEIINKYAASRQGHM